MTKYVTVEQCLAAIQADSAWRKKEISLLKQRVSKAEGQQQATLIRASILILYAHWEGFVRFAAETYVEHINERVTRFKAPLSEHFRKLLMWRCVKRKGDFPHAKSPIGFLDALEEWSTRPDIFLSDDMIDSESNLNSEVLQKILRIIDVPFVGFESKQNLIDEKLLGRRNVIAHGKRRTLTIDEYSEADKEVRALLDIFQRKIEHSILESAFAEKLSRAESPTMAATTVA